VEPAGNKLFAAKLYPCPARIKVLPVRLPEKHPFQLVGARGWAGNWTMSQWTLFPVNAP